MPIFGGGERKGLGMFGTFRSFVSVIRELSFDEVRDEAETRPRLLVLAPEEGTARRVGAALVGEEDPRGVIPRALGDRPDDLRRYDAVLVSDPADSGVAAEVRRRLAGAEPAVPVLAFAGERPDDERAITELRALLMARLPERAPAFGRAYPALRPAAAKAVIDQTAKANAEFALVSNIPAIIPVVGSLAAASADFLVLTKNQLMLLFKLAAIHGRDLRDQWGIMREMLPVVGAGLFWRTVAREAASFVPLAAGTIPKVVIAYAGTVSVGRAAEFYYRVGRKPTREQLHAYYRQGAEAVRKLPLPGTAKGAAPGANGAEGTSEALPAPATEPRARGAEASDAAGTSG